MSGKKCKWCGGLFASEAGLRCHEYGFCSDDCGYMLIPRVRVVRRGVYGITRAVLAEIASEGVGVGMPKRSRIAPRRS